jgi:hypothetical protein
VSIRSFAKKVLPRRIYKALSILKNGVPPELSPSTIVPSMITTSETEFFSECARGPLPPGGTIVDLGCFMGSTAIALAQGVIESGRREEVAAYDLFTWAKWMDMCRTHGDYLPGDSFLPEARRYAGDHGGGLINMQQADLSQYQWDGRPIALLLVDAMKSFEVTRQIARSFYPALLPGAIVIHQDFKHYYTGWIHLLQFRLRDRFQLFRSVPDGGTVAFTVTSPILTDEVWAKSELETVSNDEIEEAFKYSIGLLPPDQIPNVAAAHVMLYHHLGRDDQAMATLAKYRARGLDQQGEFPWMVRHYLPSAHQPALAI